MGINYTPRTWTAGETVTALEMNTEVRDAFNGVMAAWSTFNPTWTAATTAPSLGNGTKNARYIQLGKTVIFVITITMGTTTTYGSGVWELSLPVGSPQNGNMACGAAFGVHGGTHSGGTAWIESGTYVHSYLSGGQATSTNPWTWGSGDIYSVSGIYETT